MSDFKHICYDNCKYLIGCFCLYCPVSLGSSTAVAFSGRVHTGLPWSLLQNHKGRTATRPCLWKFSQLLSTLRYIFKSYASLHTNFCPDQFRLWEQNYHRLGGSWTRHISCWILRVQSVSRCFLMGAFFLVRRWLFSVLACWKAGWRAHGHPVMRSLMPFLRSPSSRPNFFSGTPLLNVQ